MRDLEKLKKDSLASIEKWKRHGGFIATYKCPFCGEELLSTTPSTEKDEWDTICTCYECGTLHYKVQSKGYVEAFQTEAFQAAGMNDLEFTQWIYNNYTIGDNSMARELLENVLDYAKGMNETEQYTFLRRIIPQVPDGIIRKVSY